VRIRVSRSNRLPPLVVAVIAALVSSAASAAPVLWVGGTGDWFIAGNWDVGVPSSSDDATINNVGTAQVNGVGPVARSLAVGAGATGSVSGRIESTGADLGLLLGLRIGVAQQAGVNASGSASLAGGSLLGLSGGTATGSTSELSVGRASGAGAVGFGSVEVGADALAFIVSVGTLSSGDGTQANGTLVVGGQLRGLNDVGVAVGNASATAPSTATGNVTVQTGDLVLTPFITFGVGRSFNNASASGSVAVTAGTIRTEGAGALPWNVGVAFGGSAQGAVSATGIDTTAGAAAGLSIGTAFQGGTASGLMNLGTGTLDAAGNVYVGTADPVSGGQGTGTLQLGSALAAQGDGRSLQVGAAASNSILGIGNAQADGTLTASAVTGFRDVLIGTVVLNRGTNVTAGGRAIVGTGGIVNANDPGGALGVGLSDLALNNLSAIGPGARADGYASVGGDISGYSRVDIGRVTGSGEATGRLELANGTLSTQTLTIGIARGTGGTVIDPGKANVLGRLQATDATISILASGPFPGSTIVGSAFGVEGTVTQARGQLDLTRSRLEGGLLQLGVSGGTGQLEAREGSTVDVNALVLGAGAGSLGQATLDNSSLSVRAFGGSGFDPDMIVGAGGGMADVQARGSAISVERNLSIGILTLDAALARMSLEDSLLAVGGNVIVGAQGLDSRAELSLLRTAASVESDFRLGTSANLGTLFGEALLAVDAGSLDVFGALVMDIGAETVFGVQGLTRGLGGYGAIDAATAALNGELIVDFGGLGLSVLPPLPSVVFDLIVSDDLGAISGSFSGVSILNLPTGYAASWGVVGESVDIFRVTLTAANVPEPASMSLVGLALAGLLVARRRKR
jgi:hypothetical protein